ncbi:hypothetical protein [Micromonospora sp. NPDC049359]|uniref:hypothetical protein n=1 Tax=Micromonospora sp. NPDC049359 TaxID=3364270 RepID=UPI00378D15F9
MTSIDADRPRCLRPVSATTGPLADTRTPASRFAGALRPRTLLGHTAVKIAVLLLAGSPLPGCAIRSAGSARPDAGPCTTPRNASTAQLQQVVDSTRIAGPTRLWYPHPPATRLHQLIGQVSASSCDLTAGTYDVIHLRLWRSDPIMVRDIIRWRADDRSGAQLLTSYPRGYVEVTKDWWLPGEILFVEPGSAFTDSGAVRDGINRRYGDIAEPQAVLRGIASLANWYSPRRVERATTIAVLRDTQPITYYSRVIDRAGRSGIGITATGNNDRDLLILHPSTGEVLAYEYARRTPTGWHVENYFLYLTHTHSSHRWWEPPGASNDEPPPPPLHPRVEPNWDSSTRPAA